MRLIDADALKEPLELQRASYARIGATERAEAYANCLWEIAQAPTVAEDTNVLGKWISVKDRLPDSDDGVVLAIAEYDDGWCTVLAWRSEKTGWASDDPLFQDGMDVTHWMPLPEPPEEVSGDD